MTWRYGTGFSPTQDAGVPAKSEISWGGNAEYTT